MLALLGLKRKKQKPQYCCCPCHLHQPPPLRMPVPLKAITVPPPRAAHRATLILLHGLGDSGHGWSSLAAPIQKAFPGTKCIFPHAPQQPVALNMGMVMPSWYNLYGLRPSGE